MEASQDECSLICVDLSLTQKRRRMKKLVLHCNRSTVVTRYFNLDFVLI